MRDRKDGILTLEWKDFDYKSWDGIKHMTKDQIEQHYGSFEAMIIPQGAEKPYAIWTEKYIVLFLDDDPLGMASITRNPSVFSFG